MKRIILQEGQKFERLQVIKYNGCDKNGHALYLCKCDCGNIINAKASSLIAGDIKSCGCLYDELFNKENKIILYPKLNFGKCYFNNSDDYFTFDIEDIDIVKRYYWMKSVNGYAISSKKNGEKSYYFHRLVMEKYYGNLTDYVIDHINHNTLENKKYNLRKCTKDQNNLNKRPLSNTGYKYITQNENNKFRVYLPNQPNKNFDTLDEAISFRDNYLKEHPDDFRYDPNEDYINRNNPNAIHPFKFIEKQEEN